MPLRYKPKNENERLIQFYWEDHRQEGGGILHEILQDRELDDVDILWCLRRAMEERDAEAIIICGFLMNISDQDDRSLKLRQLLGMPTS